MKFIKMQGLGNDFIIIPIEESFKIKKPEEFAIKYCNRHLGIGGDGIILILPSDKAFAGMRIFNSDGSEAEMCGNGIRCITRYLYDLNRENRIFNIETKAGIIKTEIKEDFNIRVNMGEPRIRNEKLEIDIDNKIFSITSVSMGNPHVVIFEIPEEWKYYGEKIEQHHLFPKKTNVEFVNIINKSEAILKVWERGAGPTLACGTGACAATAAGIINNLLERKAKIHLTGGSLLIEWSDVDNHIYMEGPADYVFNGKIKKGEVI